MMRFGPHLPMLKWLGLNVPAMPPWFTRDWALGLLGLLSGLEFAAQRSQTAKSVLAEFDHYAKPIMAALVSVGLLDSSTANPSRQLIEHASIASSMPSLLSAAGAYWGASRRNALLRVLHDSDPDDSLHIQRLLSWAEDLWAGGGVILLLLYPFIMAIAAVGVLGGLQWLQSRARKREDNGRKTCPSCAALMYCSAVVCPKCATPNDSIHTLTWLGSTSRERTLDPADHPLLLAAKRRCPRCATRLTARTPDQACTACGHRPFADPHFANAYDTRVLARLPLVLLATVLLGAIPIVGLLPAVLLYRIQLVSPFRQYVPWSSNLLLRWSLRILFFFLVLAQLLPAVGAISVPIMAAANWLVYRGAFRNGLPQENARTHSIHPQPI